MLIRIFVELIFEGLIIGTLRGLGKLFNWLGRLITGKKKILPETEGLKRELEYKVLTLKEDINHPIRKGTKGVVLEILNSKLCLAEFFDSSNQTIEFNDQFDFEVYIENIELEKNRTHNNQASMRPVGPSHLCSVALRRAVQQGVCR